MADLIVAGAGMAGPAAAARDRHQVVLVATAKQRAVVRGRRDQQHSGGTRQDQRQEVLGTLQAVEPVEPLRQRP
jgi:hypothetical protein